MHFKQVNIWRAGLCAAGAGLLAACGGNGGDDRDVGIAIGKNATTSVNRYLWSASLETLDFLPLATADPISGLIISDWYVNPEAPEERFKTTVYILDSALRADALRVSVFRQQRAPEANMEWIDAAVNPATAREIENAILTRARQLRLNVVDD